MGDKMIARYNSRRAEIAELLREDEYLKSMGEGLIAVADDEAASAKELASFKKARDAAKKELEEYQRALPAVKERMSVARAEERKETAEREDRLAALDANIRVRQEKLSALESAISERAGVLGNLIARELT